MNSTQSKLDVISATMREAVQDAIETHRRMGRSIVVGRSGQVEQIKAKDLKPRPLPSDEVE